jgi:hypothetical protein
MRKGFNPIYSTDIETKPGYHRVIMPVYIPNLKGYYADSYEILRLSIESLLLTVHDKTLVTIINNASCTEVTNYLRGLVLAKRIDQLVDYQENKGKVDPVVAIMRGCHEQLITVTDADVLFKHGWQQAVEDLFAISKYVGMVSPLPIPSLRYAYAANSWFWGAVKMKLVRLSHFKTDLLLEFYKSIGRTDVLTIEDKHPIGIKFGHLFGIIGAGHFCATYHRCITKFIPHVSSGKTFKAAEQKYLDEPVVKAGLMRLSTKESYIYHMGNTLTSKYYNTFKGLEEINGVASAMYNEWIFIRRSRRVPFIINKLFSSKRVISLILYFIK